MQNEPEQKRAKILLKLLQEGKEYPTQQTQCFANVNRENPQEEKDAVKN